MLLQVVEQATASAYKLHEATVRGEVLFVLLQVGSDLGHALSDEGDLTFNGTCVGSATSVLGEDAGFLFFR